MATSLMFKMNGIPESVTTAWGARAILHNGFGIDIPADRQNADGPRKADLLHYLNDNFNRGQMNDKVKELVCPDYPGMKHEPPIVTLYEDDTVVVKACTQRSFGHLYLAAWFKDEE